MNTENVDMGGLLLVGWFVPVILAALVEWCLHDSDV